MALRERPDGTESIADGFRDQLSLKGRDKSATGAHTGRKLRDVQVEGNENNHDTGATAIDVETGRKLFEEDRKKRTDLMNETVSMLPSYRHSANQRSDVGTAEREDSGHLVDTTTSRNPKGRVPQEQNEANLPSRVNSEGQEKSSDIPLSTPIEESESKSVQAGLQHQDLLKTLSEKESGNLEEKAAGSLVKHIITNNILFMDSLCQHLDRDSRIIKCWRHLAYVLRVPSEVSRKCDFYTHRSPTEDLFEYLATFRPELTVQQLKDILRTIYRNDLVIMLGKFSDGQAVCDLVSQNPQVLAFLASEMDMDSRTIGNWKSLAAKCGVTKTKVDQLGMPKHGPTDNLFYYLGKVEKHSKLTVGELKDHMKAMQRNDVLLVFKKYKGFSDTCLVKDVVKQDSELLSEVGHKLDKDVRALKGWRNLAYRLDIPSETYSSFDVSKEKKSPTKLLFEWLSRERANLSIADLLEAVKKIERNDVVELITREKKSGIATTDCRTTFQIYETLTMMKKETSGKSFADLRRDLKENALEKGFQLRCDNSGNGNCMFEALADQVQRVDGEYYEPQRMRETLVQYLEENPKLDNGTEFVRFISGYERWSDYLKDMRRDKTWGDHIVLIAAANHFKRPIKVITSLPHNIGTVIMPVQIPPQQVVDNPMVLGHIAEYHYISLEPLSTARENGSENPPYCDVYRPGSFSVGAQRTVPVLNPQRMTGSHIRITREDKLKMCPTRLPFQIYGKLCRIMDTKRVFFDDFRMLAETFGMDRDDIRWLEQQNGPTDKILSAMEKTLTVERLIQALWKIEREDVAITLEKWVESES